MTKSFEYLQKKIDQELLNWLTGKALGESPVPLSPEREKQLESWFKVYGCMTKYGNNGWEEFINDVKRNNFHRRYNTGYDFTKGDK